MIDVRDGGYRSRKLALVLLGLALVLAAGRLLPAASVGDVVTGIVQLVALYLGGNVVAKGLLATAAHLASRTPSPTAGGAGSYRPPAGSTPP